MKNLKLRVLTITLAIVGIGIHGFAQSMNEINSNENLFIYRLELTAAYCSSERWTESTYKLIQDHGNFLENLGKQDILIFAGRTKVNIGDQNLFGIALIKAPSLEAAIEIMAKDPAVVNNIQKATIIPFSLGIRYFENLDINR